MRVNFNFSPGLRPVPAKVTTSPVATLAGSAVPLKDANGAIWSHIGSRPGLATTGTGVGAGTAGGGGRRGCVGAAGGGGTGVAVAAPGGGAAEVGLPGAGAGVLVGAAGGGFSATGAVVRVAAVC